MKIREEYLLEQIEKVEHDLENLVGYLEWLKEEYAKELKIGG